jgi:hypothetical protein
VTTSFRTRAANAFPDCSSLELKLHYLDWVRENWASAAAQFRRTTLYILATVVVFELIKTDTVTEVSVGPIKTGELTLVFKLIPALTAFLLYEMLTLSYAGNRYSDAYRAALHRVEPKILEEKLDRITAPAVLSLFGGVRLVDGFSEAPGRTDILKVASIITVALFLVGVLYFELHAYDVLFSRYGADDALVWVSLAVAALSLLRACTLASIFAKGRHSDDK